MNQRVRIGRQGRMVIPASIRRELGIGSGDVMLARSEAGRLVLETPDSIIRDLQQRFREGSPEGSNPVDELIEERRREAARENEE